MKLFASIGIRAIPARKTGFRREEHALLNRLLHFVRQEFKAGEILLIPARVMVLHTRHFGLRDHIEPEERQRSIHLLIGIRIDGRLQLLVSLPVRPFRGRGFPVHDARIRPVCHNTIQFTDEGHIQARHRNRKTLHDVPDRVVIPPLEDRFPEHPESRFEQGINRLLGLVNQILSGVHFRLEKVREKIIAFLFRKTLSRFGSVSLGRQCGMEGAPESKAGTRAFRRSMFDILKVKFEAAHIQIRVQC